MCSITDSLKGRPLLLSRILPACYFISYLRLYLYAGSTDHDRHEHHDTLAVIEFLKKGYIFNVDLRL